MKKPDYKDWIIAAVIIAVLWFGCSALVGCGETKRTTTTLPATGPYIKDNIKRDTSVLNVQ